MLGAMAGSSMDGLDLVLVQFFRNQQWSFSIEKYATIEYGQPIVQKLLMAPTMSAEDQKALDFEFGSWIGHTINRFLNGKTPELLAVHGHTLHHDPKKGTSWQLGAGNAIAKSSGIKSVTNFRNKDLELGGQGAPLVPYGDFSLFKEYDACLNLGGIANISVLNEKTAWDICPCNQVLNYFATKLNHPYDEGGSLASIGNIEEAFLNVLHMIDYFNQTPPKSLPNNFIDKRILDAIDPYDGLRTYSEFIARQVAFDLENKVLEGKILVTGGGAHNQFLLSRISENLKGPCLHIPNKEIVDFKEAIIFGFLGLLKFLGEINTLASSTGARQDSSGGEIHLP